MVLTTGLRQKTAAAQRRFVARVHQAGAVGMGFALGLTHRRVPPGVLAAANELELPVFEVPYETPFVAISKMVADAISADHYNRLEHLLKDHQALAASLLGGGGLPALLRSSPRWWAPTSCCPSTAPGCTEPAASAPAGTRFRSPRA